MYTTTSLVWTIWLTRAVIRKQTLRLFGRVYQSPRSYFQIRNRHDPRPILLNLASTFSFLSSTLRLMTQMTASSQSKRKRNDNSSLSTPIGDGSSIEESDNNQKKVRWDNSVTSDDEEAIAYTSQSGSREKVRISIIIIGLYSLVHMMLSRFVWLYHVNCACVSVIYRYEGYSHCKYTQWQSWMRILRSRPIQGFNLRR